MAQQIKLQCRPELLQQWQEDVEKNPEAFAAVLALSPQYVVMLVHDAISAAYLQSHLAVVEQRALAAEFKRGSAPNAVPADLVITACRLCQPITKTVGWRCTGQCGDNGGGAGAGTAP
jgi:hypothetical protein